MTSSSLSQKEAVDTLNKWGDEGFFRLNQFGNLIKIEQIAPFTCVTSSIQTQYENRSVSTESTPYSGGSVDSGAPPGMWDIDVTRPRDFEKSKKQVNVPRSEKVETCNGCSGRGKTTCSSCSGNRQVNCSSCFGSGKENCSSCSGTGQQSCSRCHGQGYNYEYKTRSESYYDYSKGSTEWRTVNESVRENCYSCSYGKVTCSSCSGNGKKTCWQCSGSGRVTCSSCSGSGIVTCGKCSGHGKIKYYKVLTIKFEYKEQKSFINHSDIPDKKLSQSSGEVIVDERRAKIQGVGFLLEKNPWLLNAPARLDVAESPVTVDCPKCGSKLKIPNKLNLDLTCPKCKHSWQKRGTGKQETAISKLTLKDEVLASVESLLKQSEEKEGRVLFQRLFVQGVEAYKVDYSKDGTPGKPIWIYGKERKIFATGTPPLDWRKVGIVSALAAAVLILLIVLIVSSVPSTTYRPQQSTQSETQEKTAVTPKGAIVRQGAGAEFPRVGDCKKGQTVTLLGVVETAKDGGAWEKIRVDNVEGYVNQRLLTK